MPPLAEQRYRSAERGQLLEAIVAAITGNRTPSTQVPPLVDLVVGSIDVLRIQASFELPCPGPAFPDRYGRTRRYPANRLLACLPAVHWKSELDFEWASVLGAPPPAARRPRRWRGCAGRQAGVYLRPV